MIFAPMSRRTLAAGRCSGQAALLLLGLVWFLAACAPKVPLLVTGAPSLALTTAPPPSTASASPQPSDTPSPTPSETPAVLSLSGTTATAAAPAATSDQGSLPLPTPDAQAATRTVRLPILMYHYVEPWPKGANLLRKHLTVQPADFAAQMAYLHSQGYVTVSLYDLMAALALGRPLPQRAVVLTFDDGYRTLMDYAAPALEPYGYTGTVFVITQLMDQNFAQYLTWPQAEALYAAGWKIEPHTLTHSVLAGRSRAYQLYEMLGSVETVQAHIGMAPRFFAYPYGKWDALTIELAKQMNLWAAVTEIPGSVHDFRDRYTLHRVRIDGMMTMKDFVQTIKNTQ